jgi:hypothetical protein
MLWVDGTYPVLWTAYHWGMGITAAPVAPDSTTVTHRPSTCPACKHVEAFARPEFSLWSIVTRKRPAVHTCAHTDVEQDGLVDEGVRCDCAHIWHATGSQA